MERLHVELDARGYDILVGEDLLARAPEFIGPLLARNWVPIVTDSNIATRHLEKLQTELKAAGIASDAIVLEPGEERKSFAGLEQLCDRLIALKAERRDLIIALGGGVIGDLTGLAASLLRRGMGFVQIPTTLLAQVDSSVGGKTAINARHGKNLIGAFHQPRLVLADVDLLSTLPRRELLAGYAEVVKYGLLGNAPFFDWLEQHGQAVIEGGKRERIHAVIESCRHKARIVAADEREEGERALLNLGHTFGHALEAETGFSSRLLHGEGVAIGMVLAMKLSVRLGLCPPQDAERASRHLAAVGLPISPTQLPQGPKPSPEALFHHMRQDKKVQDGRVTFILSRGIGQAFVSRDVAEADVLGLLKAELA